MAIRRSMTAMSLAAAMVSGLALFGAGGAQAAPVEPASAQGGWQCSVPPGMTYDWVTDDATCGVPDCEAYDVVAPSEGLWACMVPVGWNWTDTEVSTLCTTNPGFPTTAYRLTKA